MLSVDEKIENFKKLLKEDVAQNNEKQLQELKEKLEKEASDYERTIDRKIKDKEIELNQRYKTKKDKLQATSQSKGQSIVMGKYASIRRDFELSLKEKVKEKYRGEKGAQFLKKALKDLKSYEKQEVIFYVGPEFEQRDKEIILSSFSKAVVKTNPIIELGGVIVDNLQKTVRINCSLDNVMESKKEQIDMILGDQI